MTQLIEVQAHIGSMKALLDIVGAMRALAGMRMQEAQQALPGVRRYAEAMAAGLGSALFLLPETLSQRRAPTGNRALIVCAGEHGLVGGFNERVVDAAASRIEARDELYVLGSRGAALALERGQRILWSRPMATRVAAAPESVNRLMAELYAGITRRRLSRVEVIFARYRQGYLSEVESRTLLPLDTAALASPAAQGRQGPLHNLSAQSLLEGLAAEYLFARLTEAAVESIASENAARFAAMESAHDNASRKLAELQQTAHEVRQAEITAELLDLIVGAQAVARR